ncbi:MAG TPA: hypothetical protein VM715_07515 [Candidatus Acidoferrum sp.]|jgi:hypothetical protein|nr:hypothetical protein [Candidatus Acidoferrum sp.]
MQIYQKDRAADWALFMNNKNIARLRKLIAISENDPARNEERHQTLLLLLAEEEAKESVKA